MKTLQIDNRDYVSIPKASKLLGMKYGTLYQRAYRNKLPLKRVGGCILVALDDIQKMQKESENSHV